MLDNISLEKYNLETLVLLKRLREGLLSKKAEVCIERARFVTRYLRDMSTSEEPTPIRYATATRHFLSNKKPFFPDDNLLAGTTTSKAFGSPVYPEWTGLTIWPELETISTREKNPLRLTRADAAELNFDIFPYWMERNILEYTRKKYKNPRCMQLFERIVFFIASKAGCISHTVPNYRVVLDKGLDYLIEQAASSEAQIAAETDSGEEQSQALDFYRAAQIAMKGVIQYARNLSAEASALAEAEQNPARKDNLLEMAAVCSRVPAKGARSFREALNSLWLLHVAIHAENINMAISPGRLDQILYRYYKRDIEADVITVRDAIELVGCLWLKLNDNTSLVPEVAEELFGGAGTVPAVTIGGVDEDGNDAVNDLTYIMLRVTELLKTRDPSLNARYHYQKNTPEYRNRISNVIINTKAVPAIHNDVEDIAALENQGITTKHARDYAIIGCVELSSTGRSYDASSSIMLNLVSVLELALYNGKRPVTGDEQIGPVTGDPEKLACFEDFFEAFTTQLKWLVEEAVELNEYFGKAYQEVLPSPLLSCLFEGPMETGKDLIFGGALYNSSGITHIGFADTVDSLNAIEQCVYIEKKCSFAELIQALKNDFKGSEKLRAYLVNRTPKYGTEDPIAVKNSRNLVRLLYDTHQGHINYRGGRYRPAYWTMTNHAGQGKLSGALPNGRSAYSVFASGITPVSQAAGNLTSCLNAVAFLGSSYMPGGMALNLKYPFVEGEQDIKKFGHTFEAYFRQGGMQVQYNIMSYETLIDAKRFPEKYPELLVRVSGYSAYFKDLNDAMKEEIITRTAYNIRTNKAVKFPENAI